MSTTVISDSFKIKKGSPLCNNINKNLLTPCRQIGLSRKRKTSASCSIKTISQDSDFDSVDATNLPISEITPKQSIYIKNEVSSVVDVLQSKLKDSDFNDKCYVGVSKNIYRTTNNEKTPNHNRKLIKRLSKDFSNLENINYKNETSEKTAIDDCENNKDEHTIFPFKKSHSARCNQAEINVEEINGIHNFKVQLQKLSEEEVKNYLNKCVIESEKFNKQSTPNLADTTFFTSSPEEERMKRKKLEKDIKLLEDLNKQKREILENLQRASFYKNKHNIKDLKGLTSVWLKGCIEALNGLVTHLQAHGSIDKKTVLNNMGIPKEIVMKLYSSS